MHQCKKRYKKEAKRSRATTILLQFEKEITFTDRRALIIWKAIKEREKLDSAPKTSLHTLGAPILFSLIVHLVQNRGKTA